MICPVCNEIYLSRSNLKVCTACGIKRKIEQKKVKLGIIQRLKEVRVFRNKTARAKHELHELQKFQQKRHGKKTMTDKEDILLYYDEGIPVERLAYYLEVHEDMARHIICMNWKDSDNPDIREKRKKMCNC